MQISKLSINTLQCKDLGLVLIGLNFFNLETIRDNSSLWGGDISLFSNIVARKNLKYKQKCIG